MYELLRRAKDCLRRYRLRRVFPGVRLMRYAQVVGACSLGEGVSLGYYVRLWDTHVGRYSYLDDHASLRLCKVGAFCSIAGHVEAGLGRHPTRRHVSTYPGFYSLRPAGLFTAGSADESIEEYLPVEIGNDVWIGAHVLIPGGVTIGNGAIIGAGAVVTHDIPPYAVAVGVPARVVRRRFSPEEITFLLELRWWDRDLAWIREYAPLFHDVQLLRREIRGEV